MSSVNKAIIVGNLGKDPEIRSFQNGGRVASFSIATSEAWKDKTTGDRREKTEWHRVSVFNEHIVAVVEQYVRKGAKVYLEGQLETRKWIDKDGIEKFTTEIVLKPFRGVLTMLDSAKGKDNCAHQAEQSPVQPESNVPVEEFLSDSIPF